jgi:hypothetical protein
MWECAFIIAGIIWEAGARANMGAIVGRGWEAEANVNAGAVAGRGWEAGETTPAEECTDARAHAFATAESASGLARLPDRSPPTDALALVAPMLCSVSLRSSGSCLRFGAGCLRPGLLIGRDYFLNRYRACPLCRGDRHHHTILSRLSSLKNGAPTIPGALQWAGRSARYRFR